MRVSTDWDRYSKGADSTFSKLFFLNHVIKAYSDLLKDIDFEEPIEVLEFGCGTGYISKWICQKYNGTWITKYNECEYISQEICEKHLSGTFYECAPGCRHVEDAEDVCKMPCVDVCVIE